MIKFSELDDALRKLVREIEKNPQDLVLRGAKEAEGILKERVFNKGKTKSGQSFVKYKTESWKKKRSEAGRQVAHKDLQMTGDLAKSIKTGRRGKKNAVVEFDNTKAIKIADGQEGQIGKGLIFELSDKELKQVFRETQREFSITLNKAIKKSFR